MKSSTSGKTSVGVWNSARSVSWR